MVVAREQIKLLEQQVSQVEAQINALPKKSQEYLRLSRDVTVYDRLYTALLAKAQDLRITEAGTTGHARIIDSAIPPTFPIRPDKSFIVGVGLVLGLFLGFVAVLIRRTLSPRIRDPMQLERVSGKPLYAIIPHSETEARLDRGQRKTHTRPLLAAEFADDPSVEALCSLRTNLQFMTAEATGPKIIIVASISPGCGKSFVAGNLAWLIASAGRRVLLIDSDLRRGHLHWVLGRPRSPGLADYLDDKTDVAAVISEITPSLSFVPTGLLPLNPSEFFLRPGVEQKILALTQAFDFMLMDLSPILAVADSLALMPLAMKRLLVIKAGQNDNKEVRIGLDRYAQAGFPIDGLVYNNLPSNSLAYRYLGYGRYQYKY